MKLDTIMTWDEFTTEIALTVKLMAVTKPCLTGRKTDEGNWEIIRKLSKPAL